MGYQAHPNGYDVIGLFSCTHFRPHRYRAHISQIIRHDAYYFRNIAESHIGDSKQTITLFLLTMVKLILKEADHLRPDLVLSDRRLPMCTYLCPARENEQMI